MLMFLSSSFCHSWRFVHIVFIFVNHTNAQVGPDVSQVCVHQPILFHIQLLNVFVSKSQHQLFLLQTRTHHSHDSEPRLIGRFICVTPFVNAILCPDALTAALTRQGKLSEWLPRKPQSDAAAGHSLHDDNGDDRNVRARASGAFVNCAERGRSYCWSL